MTNCLVRVELHAARAEHYGRLHEAMARLGFSRTVFAADGAAFDLPSAEYYLVGSTLTCLQVRDRVMGRAHAIREGAWVLVAAVSELSWCLRRGDR